MMLQDYFADQLHQLRLFFDEPESGAKLLAVDETLIPIVERTLVKLDGLEDNPHVLHPTTVPFSDPAGYASAVLGDLVAENEVFRDDFAAAGDYPATSRRHRSGDAAWGLRQPPF